ncbi:hypothetical protein FisN_17Hu178 [Fistulifera solaris]|uniref:Uncharacterized protein n=1 Tax=Fistulifera solaris TaxID=1519565 RepID=A0A1Z5JGW7_FISSO|nr:hypothetical protein FisN_17Hu178 [Fistulifera solaris]|eukprot:GAX13243.1 hypothetical protein FisN_17Hu178 [Fistulifera solaris]
MSRDDSGKLASVNPAAAIGDSDSDSDVEFLFTLPSEPNESESTKKVRGFGSMTFTKDTMHTELSVRLAISTDQLMRRRKKIHNKEVQQSSRIYNTTERIQIYLVSTLFNSINWTEVRME